MTNIISLIQPPIPDESPVHIMLDTETLGLDGNAIILSIGAVAFTHTSCGWDSFGNEFYTDINPESFPGSVDISTIKWWMEQCAKGTPAPVSGVLTLPESMGLFNEWLLRACDNNPKRLVVWANGTDFDLPKITNAYKLCGVKVPWGYNSVRDARTIFKTFSTYGIKPPEINKHDALADARWQTEYLISILNNLGEHIDVK